MGVFMEPVIDELIHAWEKGVWTYDRAIKTSFPSVWVICRLVCSWEVPMPNMQGSCEVHLVEEGWQVFVVRQASSIPPF